MKTPEVTKRPDEEFAIGFRYTSPDLEEDETITEAVITITGSEEVIDLVVDGAPTIEEGNLVKQKIKAGTADEEYKVIFKITTSVGYIFEDFIYVKVRSL